ncbi:MAG: YcaO-like family protein [Patescibacteria group bacterium]
MIHSAHSLETVWRGLYRGDRTEHARINFLRFLERQFGAHLVQDDSEVPFGRPDMLDLFSIAEKMFASGVAKLYYPAPYSPDEPPFALWYMEYIQGGATVRAAGGDITDERSAFSRALAEATERYIWFTQSDMLVSPTRATVSEIQRKGTALTPDRFASFNPQQRKKDPRFHIQSDSLFLWTRATSLITKKMVWLPAQTISRYGMNLAVRGIGEQREPIIRPSITTGLATHPEKSCALLSGALEVIERDAYMLTWLNQITPPRIPTHELVQRRPSLATLVALCEQYRLQPHFIRLVSDAPTYSIGAFLEDLTPHAPKLGLGLKSDCDPALAAERALIEALRARRGARAQIRKYERKGRPIATVRHTGQRNRLVYWAQADRHKHLQFLLSGKEQPLRPEIWDSDSPQQHLDRIIHWCSEQGYECASVSFTQARANHTPWHIEMVVIPELIPIHYTEATPPIGGARIHDVPKRLGFRVRSEPYTNEPHPFA